MNPQSRVVKQHSMYSTQGNHLTVCQLADTNNSLSYVTLLGAEYSAICCMLFSFWALVYFFLPFFQFIVLAAAHDLVSGPYHSFFPSFFQFMFMPLMTSCMMNDVRWKPEHKLLHMCEFPWPSLILA